jgi:site-specific recombinase XerD
LQHNRHARASHWLDDGSSVAQVSVLLGHSSVQVTMDYLDITPDTKAEAMRPIVGEPQPKRWKEEAGRSLLDHCGF